MNHPKNYRGLIHLHEPVTSWPYMFGCMHRGFAGYAGLRLSEARQRELQVLNSYVRFEPIFPWSDDEGVESAVLIAKRSALALKALSGRSKKKVVELRDYSETGDDTDLQNARKSAADWFGVGWNVVAMAAGVLPTASRESPRGADDPAAQLHEDGAARGQPGDPLGARQPFGRPPRTARPRSASAWPCKRPRARARAAGVGRLESPPFAASGEA